MNIMEINFVAAMTTAMLRTMSFHKFQMDHYTELFNAIPIQGEPGDHIPTQLQEYCQNRVVFHSAQYHRSVGALKAFQDTTEALYQLRETQEKGNGENEG